MDGFDEEFLQIDPNRFLLIMPQLPFSLFEQISSVYVNHLLGAYQEYCAASNCNPNPDHLLRYLIERNFISAESMRHYAVIKEYKAMRATKRFGTKTKTIETLASRFGVHENTIWNILKDQRNKFKPRPKGRQLGDRTI